MNVLLMCISTTYPFTTLLVGKSPIIITRSIFCTACLTLCYLNRTQNHPGGSYNIMKFAEGWDGHDGWYLNFPLNGNSTRNIPMHPMSRWDNNAQAPNIEFVARFGDSIVYRDLPNDLKTDGIAEKFGAISDQVLEGGVVVCGSAGEGEKCNITHFDIRFDLSLNHYCLRFKLPMILLIMKYLRLAPMDEL